MGHYDTFALGVLGDLAQCQSALALVFLKDVATEGSKSRPESCKVDSVFGPVAEQAEFVAILESGGDLFDSDLFEVGWQRCLARAGRVTGHDVAAGVSDSGS